MAKWRRETCERNRSDLTLDILTAPRILPSVV
jgi:hypothetical protein